MEWFEEIIQSKDFKMDIEGMKKGLKDMYKSFRNAGLSHDESIFTVGYQIHHIMSTKLNVNESPITQVVFLSTLLPMIKELK